RPSDRVSHSRLRSRTVGLSSVRLKRGNRASNEVDSNVRTKHARKLNGLHDVAVERVHVDATRCKAGRLLALPLRLRRLCRCWPRNRAVEEHVRISDISIMKEPSVRGDVVALFANLEDALVILRALMVAELSALRDGWPHVPGLEVPQRSDVPSVFRVLVAQEPRPPPGMVPLPSFAFRDRSDVDHRSFAAEFRDGDL